MMELLEMMQASLDAKNQMTDKVHENITKAAQDGNKEAQTIINCTSDDKELKRMISKAIHQSQ